MAGAFLAGAFLAGAFFAAFLVGAFLAGAFFAAFLTAFFFVAIGLLNTKSALQAQPAEPFPGGRAGVPTGFHQALQVESVSISL